MIETLTGTPSGAGLNNTKLPGVASISIDSLDGKSKIDLTLVDFPASNDSLGIYFDIGHTLVAVSAALVLFFNLKSANSDTAKKLLTACVIKGPKRILICLTHMDEIFVDEITNRNRFPKHGHGQLNNVRGRRTRIRAGKVSDAADAAQVVDVAQPPTLQANNLGTIVCSELIQTALSTIAILREAVEDVAESHCREFYFTLPRYANRDELTARIANRPAANDAIALAEHRKDCDAELAVTEVEQYWNKVRSNPGNHPDHASVRLDQIYYGEQVEVWCERAASEWQKEAKLGGVQVLPI